MVLKEEDDWSNLPQRSCLPTSIDESKAWADAIVNLDFSSLDVWTDVKGKKLEFYLPYEMKPKTSVWHMRGLGDLKRNRKIRFHLGVQQIVDTCCGNQIRGSSWSFQWSHMYQAWLKFSVQRVWYFVENLWSLLCQASKYLQWMLWANSPIQMADKFSYF